MADAKGKYAVDIEDGQEEEEGIPQWAIFAGIGGLLLVIIIIIIVVVAGGSAEKKKEEAKKVPASTTPPEITTPVTVDEDTAKAIDADLEKVTGTISLGAGLPPITIVDVATTTGSTAVKAAFDAGDDTKTIAAVTPFTSVVKAEITLPAGADMDTYKADAATALQAQYMDLMGLPKELVDVTVELIAKRRELEEDAAARRLSTGYVQNSAVSAVLPVADETTTVSDKLFNDMIITATVKAAKTMEKYGAKVTKMEEPQVVKAEPIKNAKISEIKSAAKAYNKVMKAAVAESLKTTDKVISFAEMVTKAKEAVAEIKKEVPTIKEKVTINEEQKPVPKEEPKGNSTGNSTRVLQRRVRRGLQDAGVSAYYAQMLDRLVV